MRTLYLLAALTCLVASCAPQNSDSGSGATNAATGAELRALYEARDWFGLRAALEASGPAAPPLFQAAVAAAFNDAGRAEALLASQLDADRTTENDDAYEAFTVLGDLTRRQGRFDQFFRDAELKWSTPWDNRVVAGEAAAVEHLRGLPDQVNALVRRSVVAHDGTTEVPATIAGQPVRYAFDTGAGISALSESEARRLGLTVRRPDSDDGFPSAVVRELSVGNVRLANVSFAVFSDTYDAWSQAPPGRRGVLGLPVLLAFGSVRWSRDGTLTLNPMAEAEAPTPEAPNLAFDGTDVLVEVDAGGKTLPFRLDSGAGATTVNEHFGEEFPELVPAGARELVGADGREGVLLPEVTLTISGVAAELSPVRMVRGQDEGRWAGSIGLDVLQQGSAFTIDFVNMRVTLE